MLLEIGLLSLQGSDLGLQLVVLVLLGKIRLLHVFFRLKDVVGKSLSDFLSFSCQSIIKCLLFRPESLNFLLVEVELLLQCLDSLFEAIYLALKCSSESASSHCLIGVTH